MALFGKKKPAEKPALQSNPEDDIQVMGGDADETGLEEDSGQVIDFDSIAQDLNAHDDDSTMDAFLGRNPAAADAPNFGAPISHGADVAGGLPNLDDEIDFNTPFDAGVPVAPVATDANPFADTPDFGSAPTFGDTPDFGNAPDIEPVIQAPAIPMHAPPMTYTAPILTSDLAASGSAPAMKKSLPLPMLLGAAGLLVALGIVGYLVSGGGSKPQQTAPVVVAAKPITGPITGMPSAPAGAMSKGALAAPGGPSGAVNQGIAVDGVAIAPGVVIQQAPIGAVAPGQALGTAPALSVGTANPNLTPAVQKQLKALWIKGADAKHSGNFAGARAAWTQMLTLSPDHSGVQEAIGKLPSAKKG